MSLATKIPLTEFIGMVRRVDTEHQEEIAATVLSIAFPRFAAINELFPSLGPYPKPNRRFAGGESLPRGRYHSVCSSSTPDDHGTLANELWAYADQTITGPVEIEDLAFPRWIHTIPGLSFCKNSSTIGGPNTNRLAVIFMALENGEKTYFENLVEAFPKVPTGSLWHVSVPGDSDEIQWAADGCYVYYTTELVQIQNTLDLRQFDAQEFLVELVGSGELGLKLSLGDYPFINLLTALCHPDLGGGVIDDRIGTWLRMHGVGALVFPSARSDTFLRIKNGVTEDWRHWNLVDYRDTPLPKIPEMNAINSVTVQLLPNARIEHPNSCALRGSFLIDGVISHYSRLRDSCVAQEKAGKPRNLPHLGEPPMVENTYMKMRRMAREHFSSLK